MVMFRTNVADAKAKLSEYLDRAARGERILICRHNKPIAELRGVEEFRSEPRPVGPLPERPTFTLTERFFDPLSDEELASWEGPDKNSDGTDAGARTSRVAQPRTPYRGRPAARGRSRRS